MRATTILALLTASALVLGSAAAHATNLCKAETMSCATTMPVGGYCECHAKGETKSGTVVENPEKAGKDNATAGGCGAHPDAPGCK